MENRDEFEETVDSAENGNRETGDLPAEENREAPEEENEHREGTDALDILGNILGGIFKVIGVLALIVIVFVALVFGVCAFGSMFGSLF